MPVTSVILVLSCYCIKKVFLLSIVLQKIAYFCSRKHNKTNYGATIQRNRAWHRPGKTIRFLQAVWRDRGLPKGRTNGAGVRATEVVCLRAERVFQVHGARHQQRQRPYSMVFFWRWGCGRLPQLALRESISVYNRGGSAMHRGADKQRATESVL